MDTTDSDMLPLRRVGCVKGFNAKYIRFLDIHYEPLNEVAASKACGQRIERHTLPSGPLVLVV